MQRPSSDEYVRMQKRFYNEHPVSEENIVGNYDFHQNFPYETNILYRYADLRKPSLQTPSEALAFDIGCGEGRMIRRMSKYFRRVDGADISEKMAQAARERCQQAGIKTNVYVTQGANCGDAESNTYHLVYNTISLHHICVYDVRASILNDIARILRPDGVATLHFFFSKYYPYVRSFPPLVDVDHLVDVYHRDESHADWFENRTGATVTNSGCDGAFGTSHIPRVLEDFKKWFESAEVWFHDMSIGRPDPRGSTVERILPETHPNCHGFDFAWFTHAAFFHLRGPRKNK